MGSSGGGRVGAMLIVVLISFLQFTVIPGPPTWALLALAFVLLAVRSTKPVRSRKPC